MESDLILTAARLRELLHYDPATGVFTWRVRGRGRQSGPLGCPTKKGYLQIRVDGRLYYNHRLAWLYERGVWPDGDLDHEDNIKAHNWIANLRPATATQNRGNQRRRGDSHNAFKGVVRVKGGRYGATIQVGGKRTWLGTRDSEREAHDLYCAAAKSAFGEFARAA